MVNSDGIRSSAATLPDPRDGSEKSDNAQVDRDLTVLKRGRTLSSASSPDPGAPTLRPPAASTPLGTIPTIMIPMPEEELEATRQNDILRQIE